MSPEAELIEAATEFVALLEDKLPPFQVKRDSKLRREHRAIALIFKRRFSAQRKSVMGSTVVKRIHRTLLKQFPHPIVESDQDDAAAKARLVAEITSQLSPLMHAEPIPAKSAEAFNEAMDNAISVGAEVVTHHLGSAAASTDSFVAEYLKDHGLANLTGEIDRTSVNRLARAIADAYDRGEDFDGILRAVKSEFSDFSTKRIKMIAQTELNTAYNKGVLHFGQESGATRKSWTTDLAPCLICTANAVQGEIGFDDLFLSGQEAPPAHPNCLCSLMVHA